VRVPVVNGHSEAVNVQTRRELSPERAREVLRAAPGVTVLDDPEAALYPLAVDASGHDDVLSRIPAARHERALGRGSSPTTCSGRRQARCSSRSNSPSADSRRRRRSGAPACAGR
jgi:hypothetical protein